MSIWLVSLIKISGHATLASFAVSKSDCTDTLLMPSFCLFWSQSESDCTEALFVASFSVWSQSWCRTISINSVPAFEGSSKADCINFGNMFRPFHKGKSYPDRCCLIGLIFSSYNIIVQEDLVHMDFRRAISS